MIMGGCIWNKRVIYNPAAPAVAANLDFPDTFSVLSDYLGGYLGAPIGSGSEALNATNNADVLPLKKEAPFTGYIRNGFVDGDRIDFTQQTDRVNRGGDTIIPNLIIGKGSIENGDLAALEGLWTAAPFVLAPYTAELSKYNGDGVNQLKK